ncbi:MAG TPA: hypothetical protein VGR43_05505, partial [Dehalococcoidia bacterium]|nr:hypothetical protein [Dehalococcoidia bacterium]
PSGTPSPGELTAGSAKEQLVIATDEEHHPLVMFYTALLARAQRTLCATPDLFAHLGIRSFRSTSIELERSRSQNPE